MKRSMKYMLQSPEIDPSKADVVEPAPSAMAPAVNPEEHGITGPQGDDPGKAVGVVGGQEEREAAAGAAAGEEPAPGAAAGEEPAASEEPAAEEEPAPGAAAGEEQFEEFEITLADDSLMSQESFDALMDVVEKKGFTKEEAESLIKGHEDALEMGSKLVHDALLKKSQDNNKALINDPLFEGDFKKALTVMSKPVQQFGDEGFNELLASEIGNHPALGRFLFNLGKAMESDTFQGKGGEVKPVEKDPLKTLYPSFFE